MAGKRKNKEDAWMPPRVFRGKSAYEFKPASNRTIKLCPLDVSRSQVWICYEQALNERKDKSTFQLLVDQFLMSADFIELAKETQKDYKKYSQKILPVFGKMGVDSIKPEHIRVYMDKRGLNSRTQANREKTFMSRVFRWGYERGLVKINPCQGVKQYKEKARERYITDDEYSALYSVAPVIVQIAMEIAYLCCARQSDVIGLKRDQLLESGIFIKQGKTGVKQIKGWSDRLRKIIKLADSLPLDEGISTFFLIHQRNGLSYSRDGFNTRWRQAKKEAQVKFPGLTFDFTFHDLKAKGISDLEGSLHEKQSISGHKNINQTARYDRKVQVVAVVGNQKK